MDYDLTIVGAGIVGTLAAYFANKKNKTCKILLVDKQLIGHGATAFSAGLDYPYAHNQEKLTLTRESIALWREVEHHIQNATTKMPFYGITSNKNCDKFISNFLGDSLVTENALEDFKSSHNVSVKSNQALLSGGVCSHYDTRAVLSQLTQLLLYKKNLDVWEGLSVDEISPLNGSFQLSLSDDTLVTSKKILLALGPWAVSSDFLELFQPLELRTKRIVTLHINTPEPIQESTICLLDEDAFLLPIAKSNRYIFSFTRFSWDCSPDTSAFTLTKKDKEEGLAILRRYFPKLVNYCHGGQVFCDAYSENLTPVMRESNKHSGLVIASGGSGSGFRLAPSMAMHSINLLEV